MLFVVIIFPYCSDAQFVIRFKDGSSIQLGGSNRHNKERLQYEQYVKSKKKERKLQLYNNTDSLPQKPRLDVEDDNQRQQSATERYFSDRKTVNNDKKVSLVGNEWEDDRDNQTANVVKEETFAEVLEDENVAIENQESAVTPQSNEKIVTLVVNGTGQNKEEATKKALRSAIEQAFGTFVSANTEVLNDELIKDEITTVSTGNIKSYKELSITQTSNGLFDASIQATVSIDQLTKFAQNKGMQAELAGASFVMNMKMRELNKKNEVIAIQHMIEKVKAISEKGLFDYKIVIGEPYLTNDSKYAINLKILFCENANTQAFYNTIYKTFEALGLSEKERKEYEQANMRYYKYMQMPVSFYLRNDYDGTINSTSYNQLMVLFYYLLDDAALRYKISDNLGNSIYVVRKEINEVTGRMSWDIDREKDFYRDKYNGTYDLCSYNYGYRESMSKIYKVTGMVRFDGIPTYVYYFLSPANRIVNRGSDSKLKNYEVDNHQEYSHDFDPMYDSSNNPFDKKRIQQRKEKKIYFQQDLIVLYSENELSKLKNIIIEPFIYLK